MITKQEQKLLIKMAKEENDVNAQIEHILKEKTDFFMPGSFKVEDILGWKLFYRPRLYHSLKNLEEHGLIIRRKFPFKFPLQPPETYPENDINKWRHWAKQMNAFQKKQDLGPNTFLISLTPFGRKFANVLLKA